MFLEVLGNVPAPTYGDKLARNGVFRVALDPRFHGFIWHGITRESLKAVLCLRLQVFDDIRLQETAGKEPVHVFVTARDGEPPTIQIAVRVDVDSFAGVP